MPRAPTRQATPQELRSLGDALRDASDAIDSKIKSTLDPLSPQGQHLRDISLHLATYALKIGTMAVAALAQGVGPAINDLTQHINEAKQVLTTITSIDKAMSIAAAMLSVAASVASRDPIGTVQGVTSLISLVQNATTAAGPLKAS